MSRSNKLQVFGAKLETAQNTPDTFAATDYCLVEDCEVNPIPEFLRREYKHASLSSLVSLMGKLYVEVKVKVAWKGSDADTGYAPHDALLQACGLINTAGVYAFTSAAITSFTGFSKSITIEVYEAGPVPIKHQIKGCVAKSAKLTSKAGGFLILDATYNGLYVAPTDSTFPSVTLAETIHEPILQSASFTTHTYAGIISSIEIDLGLETVLREDANSAYGVGGFTLLSRKVTGTIDPEVVSVADHDFWGKSLSRAEAAIGLTIAGNSGVDFEYFIISMPKTQYNDVNYAERSALKVFKVPFQANENTGDDELTITTYGS
jgi:hypothetical protein